jgi:hypothetical protein
MTIKLNGSQRIGIVLSIIGFIGFGLYFWNDAVKTNGEYYKQGLNLCYDMLTDRNNFPHILSDSQIVYNRCCCSNYDYGSDKSTSYQNRSSHI